MCPYLARICRGRSTGCFIYNFLFQVISERTLQQRFNQEFERCFYMKIIVTIIRIDLDTNFILFLSFLANQKQELDFQQVGGLVTRNTSVFCSQRVTLYFTAMPRLTFIRNFLTCYSCLYCSCMIKPICTCDFWVTSIGLRISCRLRMRLLAFLGKSLVLQMFHQAKVLYVYSVTPFIPCTRRCLFSFSFFIHL